MSGVTEKMIHAGDSWPGGANSAPKTGERLRCQRCGMELEVKADCRCDQPGDVCLQCCGEDMRKI